MQLTYVERQQNKIQSVFLFQIKAMWKMMFLIQITIYYSICVTMIHGNVASSIKYLIQSNGLKNEAPAKLSETVTKTNPDKSNLERFSDMSNPMDEVNADISDGDNTLNDINKHSIDNDNQRNAINGNQKTWSAVSLGNKIDVGTNRAYTKEINGNTMLEQSSGQHSNIKYQPSDSHKQNHRRFKRGFRSAVADRIAHGFGKRTPLLALGDSSIRGDPLSQSDLQTIRDAINQPAFQVTKQYLSLKPVSFDDATRQTDDVFRKLLPSHQTRSV